MRDYRSWPSHLTSTKLYENLKLSSAIQNNLSEKIDQKKCSKNCPPQKKINKNKIKDIVFGRKNQKC
jgi:hypothetical protein